MPLKFTPAPKCTTCDTSVFHAETQLGPGNKVYHKGCMKCLGCAKALRDATSLVDHKGEPYCKPCHTKSFGPRGYGNGGALVGEYVDRFSPSPSPSARALPPTPTNTSATRPYSQRQNEFPLSPLSPSERSATTTAQSPLGGARASPGVLNARMNSATTPTRFGAVKEVCPACSEVVYFAEAVLAAGSKWHKRCLKCTKCQTSLSSQLSDRDGLPYCTNCYKTEFGAMSTGMMSRPGFA